MHSRGCTVPSDCFCGKPALRIRAVLFFEAPELPYGIEEIKAALAILRHVATLLISKSFRPLFQCWSHWKKLEAQTFIGLGFFFLGAEANSPAPGSNRFPTIHADRSVFHPACYIWRTS